MAESDGTRLTIEKQRTALSARANGLAWSPDSLSISFSGDRFGNMDIWTVSVPDGKVSRLTDDCAFRRFRSPVPTILDHRFRRFRSPIPTDSDRSWRGEVHGGAGGSGLRG